MKAANDNIPPILKRKEAAELCRLTPAGFDVWVRKGIVPPAIAGTRRWSRDAILRALNGSIQRADLDPFEQWELDNARSA